MLSNQPIPLSELPLNRLNSAFASLLDVLQEADAAPTLQAESALKDLQKALEKTVQDFGRLKKSF